MVKSVSISALREWPTERYFSAESVIARSTRSRSSPLPRTVKWTRMRVKRFEVIFGPFRFDVDLNAFDRLAAFVEDAHGVDAGTSA